MTIVGDFSYNLLNHETDTQVNDFIQIMLSNFCQPLIIQPTRIAHNAKPSLVDNIFFNSIEYETKSGNITSKISNHLPNLSFLKSLTSGPQKRSRYKEETSRNLTTRIHS